MMPRQHDFYEGKPEPSKTPQLIIPMWVVFLSGKSLFFLVLFLASVGEHQRILAIYFAAMGVYILITGLVKALE